MTDATEQPVTVYTADDFEPEVVAIPPPTVYRAEDFEPEIITIRHPEPEPATTQDRPFYPDVIGYSDLLDYPDITGRPLVELRQTSREDLAAAAATGTPAPRSTTAIAQRETAGSAGPDITYTNLPTVTPDRLRRSGYRLVGQPLSNVQIWRSRDNRFEIRLITSTPSTPAPQEDPAVEEARNYAEDFGAQRRRLDQQLADLRAAVGTRNYPVLKANYLAAVAAWDDAFNPVINDRIPQLWNEVDASHANDLSQEIVRLQWLLHWQQNERPNPDDLP